MKSESFCTSCVILCLVLCSGCLFNSRQVTVSPVDSFDEQRDYFRKEMITDSGLMLESENFLHGNLLRGQLKSNPSLVLKKINEYFAVSANPKYRMIAADVCRYLAAHVAEEESIRYHLSSFYYSTAYFRNFKKSDPSAAVRALEAPFSHDMTISQAFRCYNEACAGIFSYLNRRNILDASAISLYDGEDREFVLEKPSFHMSLPRETIESFSLCAAYEVKDLMQINRESGAGVPLVGTVKEKQWYTSLKTPKGLTIPVTFCVEREERPAGPIPLRLKFIDTYQQEYYTGSIGGVDNANIHMALDFSTPLACFLNNLEDRNLLAKMLNFGGQESDDGLYMVEPYQPNKIPVVFVHGLMSSPETWVQMINALKNEPTIRKRYQFWFFSYSTGAPVMASAQLLRNSLLAAEKEFCTTPEATTNFNQMVIVGHSMGGLLTRMMIQKNPYYFFEKLYQRPWKDIASQLQEDEINLVESYVPYSLPFVRRAVFMAVPHKGATMAQSPLGRLGVYCIKLPQSILSKEILITTINRKLIPNYDERMKELGNRFYTGVDNLDPDNPFVRVNGVSEMKEDVPYHCVIGNCKRADAPDGSDGIVPYWSSHLDNAASELIVKSDHSVHRRPAAMQELLRILLLHLKGVRTQNGN